MRGTLRLLHLLPLDSVPRLLLPFGPSLHSLVDHEVSLHPEDMLQVFLNMFGRRYL